MKIPVRQIIKQLIEMTQEANLMGLKHTLQYVKRSIIQKHNNYPKMFTVEASSWCNLNCVFCVTRDLNITQYRQKKFLSFPEFKKLIDETKHFCTRINFSLFGEPLANPDISRMIHYASKMGIFTVVFTNATLLTKDLMHQLILSGLHRMIISFESFEKNIYESTKCGAVQKQTEQIVRDFVQIRKQYRLKKPQLMLRVVLTQKNSHSTDIFIKKAKMMHVDAVSFKPFTVWPQASDKFKEKMMRYYVVDHHVSRHVKDKNKKFMLRSQASYCPSLYSPTLLSDGSICLCWYDMPGETKIGNINNSSFLSLWKKSQKFRESCMVFGKAYSICNECPGIGAERFETIYFKSFSLSL
jgi:radical SAM protein with 4Fe4S-binding SPASM domain